MSSYSLWKSDVRRMIPEPSAGIARRVFAALLTQGVWAVTTYRFGGWLRRRNWLLRRLISIGFIPFHKLIECLTGIQIPSSVQAGHGLYIGHFGGVILHADVVMGSNVNLSQQVTIGIGGFGENRGTPKIGNQVYIGPGAKVFGPIEIGDGCIIGANAVVNRSMPARSIVAGVPAKVVREASENEIREMIFGNRKDIENPEDSELLSSG